MIFLVLSGAFAVLTVFTADTSKAHASQGLAQAATIAQEAGQASPHEGARIAARAAMPWNLPSNALGPEAAGMMGLFLAAGGCVVARNRTATEEE